MQSYQLGVSSLKRVAAQNSLLAFTEYLGYTNAPFQEEWYLKLQNSFSPLKQHPNKLKRLLQFLPRGHGKTTMEINYISWLIGKYPNIHITLISKTATQAEEILLGLMTRMEADEYYREIFGNLKPNDSRKWTTKEIIVNRTEISKSPTIKAAGLMGPITGGRSDLIICDDIIDEENTRSQLQIEKAITWHDKILSPTLYPWGGEIVIGTRWHYADLYAALIDRYKVTPECVDVKKAIINEQTQEVLWPQYWSYPKLIEKRKEIGSIIFDCQYQNDPTSMEGSLLKAKWLQPWDNPPPATCEYYAGIDPSLGEADYFGIATVAYDRPHNQLYLVDVWAEHTAFPDILKTKIPLLNQLYHYRKMYMETNFWQKLLLNMPGLRGLPVVPIKTVTNKEQRFIPMSSHFEAKRVLVNPLLLNRGEFWTEWVQFPRGQHDDAIDCVDLVVSNLINQPKANPSFLLL